VFQYYLQYHYGKKSMNKGGLSMKKNKLLIVALIGLLTAIGLALAGCDDKGEECPRISATGEECYYAPGESYPSQFGDHQITFPPELVTCAMEKCAMNNGGSKCNCGR
jgi:hypothetical protein